MGKEILSQSPTFKLLYSVSFQSIFLASTGLETGTLTCTPKVYMEGGGMLCESLKLCIVIAYIRKCAFFQGDSPQLSSDFQGCHNLQRLSSNKVLSQLLRSKVPTKGYFVLSKVLNIISWRCHHLFPFHPQGLERICFCTSQGRILVGGGLQVYSPHLVSNGGIEGFLHLRIDQFSYSGRKEGK